MRYGSSFLERLVAFIAVTPANFALPGGTTSPGESFAGLYNEFMPKIFRYIHFKVNDDRTTEDLTSAVFEKALVNYGRYNSDKAAFSTWIFTIARNAVIDHYRTQGKRKTVALDEAAELPANDPPPDVMAEKAAEREKLRECLGCLSQEEQEIIRLKFAGEFNNREIARMVGLSESNVGTKLFRAVRKMRDRFQEPLDA